MNKFNPFNWFRGERKVSEAHSLISFMHMGRAVGTPRNYEQFSKEAYQKNVIAHQAISGIACAIAQLDWTMFLKPSTQEGKVTEIFNHQVLDLLMHPNPLQGRSQWMECVMSFYLIAGNSYWLGIPGSNGTVRELYCMRPDRMKVIPGRFGIPSGYEFTVNGRSKIFDVDVINGQSEILHWKTFNPLNDWYGQSPIEAAALDIDTNNESKQWNFSLLKNSAVPSGALVVKSRGKNAPVSLTDEQYEQIKAELNENFSGSRNSGKPMVLDGGLDYKQMGFSPKDMDWLNSKHTTARDIATAFGYPPQLLGIPGDNTFSNYKEARLALWEETILPLATGLRDMLNHWLVHPTSPKLFLDFDRDKISALEPRRQILWDRADKSQELTINEKRELKGFDERPDGDVLLVSSSSVPLSFVTEEIEPDRTVDPPVPEDD